MVRPRRRSRKGGVVAIGGANVDIKCRVEEMALPGTSNPGRAAMSFGGVAYNVARNLSELGQRVAMIGAVGADHSGAGLLQDAKSRGIDVSRFHRVAEPTGIYVALLDGGGELTTAVCDMSATETLRPRILARDRDFMRGFSMIFADCNLPSESLLYLARLACNERIGLAVDAVSVAKVVRLKSVLKSQLPIHVLSMNVDEALSIAKAMRWQELDLPGIARKLHRAGTRHILIHRGPKGVQVSSCAPEMSRPEIRTVSARTAKTRDVTGGGDASVAGTLFGLLRGESVFAAAILGQRAAAQALSSRESSLGPSPRRRTRA